MGRCPLEQAELDHVAAENHAGMAFDDADQVVGDELGGEVATGPAGPRPQTRTTTLGKSRLAQRHRQGQETGANGAKERLVPASANSASDVRPHERRRPDNH